MEKDKDMSKEELIEENEWLVGEVARLQQGLEEVQASLQGLHNDYHHSKATFTITRYGKLKDMIKQLTSDEALKKVQSLAENPADSKVKKRGLAGLIEQAQKLADQIAATTEEQPKAPASKTGGKVSGLFQRIKHATGFSDDPPDIRWLDKNDIRRDNERKKREVERLRARGQLAYNSLLSLQQRYQASKRHAPHTRYQELKDMIKNVLTDLNVRQ